MKEKIKNEYAVKNGFDDWDDLLCNALPDFGRFAINEVMDIFVNQEVEKRIAERMPPAMYGWICPRCGAVQSPYSTACHCLPPVGTWTGTSTELTKGGGE